MRVYTVVLHIELAQEADDPALWDWHDLLDLAPDEVATVEDVFDEDLAVKRAVKRSVDMDVLYAINVSDPAAPVVTDSLVLNTRRVNDVMSTPDGKFIVFTREGAADRKNGIVIASTEDPEHPKVIAEFTEGVTSGVHSAFVYKQDKYGTNVFLTNDGTGAMHVINIDDPYHPKEIAQWRTDRPDAGRTLHDIDVQDGLAYLSYWNDGLVILDVGGITLAVMETALHQARDDVAAVRVVRVRLAGEDEQHGTIGVAYDLAQHVEIVEQQRRALVRREAPGETRIRSRRRPTRPAPEQSPRGKSGPATG